MVWRVYVVCLLVLTLTHLDDTSPTADNVQPQKRDVAGRQNARDTLGNTLGNWRNGVLKFFSDGIRVESETNDVTRTIHTFSRNIGDAGNAFVETVHGSSGARTTRPAAAARLAKDQQIAGDRRRALRIARRQLTSRPQLYIKPVSVPRPDNNARPIAARSEPDFFEQHIE